MERTASGDARHSAAGEAARQSDFAQWDQNSDGDIDLDELFAVLSAKLGFTREQARQVMAAIDTDGDGMLSAPEFAAWQAQLQTSPPAPPAGAGTAAAAGAGPQLELVEPPVAIAGTSSMSRQTSTSENEPPALDTTPRPDLLTVDLTSEASAGIIDVLKRMFLVADKNGDGLVDEQEFQATLAVLVESNFAKMEKFVRSCERLVGPPPPPGGAAGGGAGSAAGGAAAAAAAAAGGGGGGGGASAGGGGPVAAALAANPAAAAYDFAFEHIKCPVCRDVLHNPVSLVPCLHNRCAACCSAAFSRRQNKCVECRAPIESVRRNHGLLNLVTAYLAQHPERRRPADEIAKMDAETTITADVLRVSSRDGAAAAAGAPPPRAASAVAGGQAGGGGSL
eukprot:SAG22_NODE_1643_length_3905_cov_153.165528_1_plen_393_part_10